MIDFNKFNWTRKPKIFSINRNELEITTEPKTDLWQRTYYKFRNDNAPLFQTETEKLFFPFTVKTDFSKSRRRFDQCGIVLYLDGENWLKASVEYENEKFSHLGSVVTNEGFSDWATTEIDGKIKTVWYRLSRRESDYKIESSFDGANFKQMRICHLNHGDKKINFGVYACSPEDSSFTAKFSDLSLEKCSWQAHDGQQPDED